MKRNMLENWKNELNKKVNIFLRLCAKRSPSAGLPQVAAEPDIPKQVPNVDSTTSAGYVKTGTGKTDE